ncbi:MAG: hypothetical protein DI570_06565 [Phenylobacterium zucineum]|nr:MAG: hypothetical protein DI570_06565 [Phenylobacterium zucineum]
MKAITADPRMPAYCTVYRWMQVVPEFGDLVAEARAALAANHLAERDAWRRVHRDQRPRRRGGRRSTLTGERLERMLNDIRAGYSLSDIVADPQAPSVRVIYRALNRCPGFRAVFMDACERRADWLEMHARQVGDEVALGRMTIPAANAEMRAIMGWRGRMTPKLYRTRPRPKSDQI